MSRHRGSRNEDYRQGYANLKNMAFSVSLAFLAFAAAAGIINFQHEPPMDAAAKAALTEKFTDAAIDRQMQEWIKREKPSIAKSVSEEVARGLPWEKTRDYIVLGQIDMEKVRDDVGKEWKMMAPPSSESRTAAVVFGTSSLLTGVAGLYYRSREKKFTLPQAAP